MCLTKLQKNREVSVLFADIRNFTSISERIAPTDLLDLLNKYFTQITAVIERHHGVVDKYIGDEVMAVFGAPIGRQDHAVCAAKSALEIMQELSSLNKQIQLDYGFPIKIGIGINSGNVVAGNVGSASRMNYTLLGDTVNIASRLQGLTKTIGTPIIASEKTVELSPGFNWKNHGMTSIRGKQKSINVYSLEP